MEDKTERRTDTGEKANKTPYETPKLVRFGDIGEITQGGPGAVPDSASIGSQPPVP